MNEIQAADFVDLSTFVQADRMSMEFHPETTYEEWELLGERLKSVSGSISFWLGDWLLFGERRWGEMYAQAVDETDYVYGTLANKVAVCKAIEPGRRRESLSWSHHVEVASLGLHDQEHYLGLAVTEDLSVRKLRALIRGDQGKTVVHSIVDEETVVADLYSLLHSRLRDVNDDATVRIRIEVKS